MTFIKSGLTVSIAATLLAAGCNKNDSTAPTNAATVPSSTAAPSVAVPGVPSPAAVAAAATAVTELAGTYHAVSEVAGQPAAKRHQTLTLKPDGTAELDTQVLKAGSTTPESSDTSTGAFTVVSREVVVTFTTKDGKPLPPADTMRVLKMTRGTGDKTLVGDDGRTFERAK